MPTVYSDQLDRGDLPLQWSAGLCVCLVQVSLRMKTAENILQQCSLCVCVCEWFIQARYWIISFLNIFILPAPTLQSSWNLMGKKNPEGKCFSAWKIFEIGISPALIFLQFSWLTLLMESIFLLACVPDFGTWITELFTLGLSGLAFSLFPCDLLFLAY